MANGKKDTNSPSGGGKQGKVDRQQLRLNAAIAAAVTWGFAGIDVDWKRHDRAAVEALVEATTLGAQMRMFPTLWSAWEKGERGRQP